MFGVGLYVYQRGVFPRKTPRWLLNIMQTWYKPYKLSPNCVHILSKPKLAGLSDTNRPNLTKFGQTRYEPGANLSRPGAAPARSPPPRHGPCCSGGGCHQTRPGCWSCAPWSFAATGENHSFTCVDMVRMRPMVAEL